MNSRFYARPLLGLLVSAAFLLSCSRPQDGEHVLQILTTNDVHGAWFSRSYVDSTMSCSLFSVKTVADGIREKYGNDNVLLIDAGDCLQGDDAAYYFNYVEKRRPHVFPRIMAAVGYDAVIVGNHDIETGHDVYDRISSEMKKVGIPWLGGNAVRLSDGKPYFQKLAVFKRAGLKVALLGYTNPNIAEWLNESLWSGMEFESLVPSVQQDVNEVLDKVRPDVMVVAAHAGTGKGDGAQLENQMRDLFDSLEGVDVLIGGHDHRPLVLTDGGTCLINSGSKARKVTRAEVRVQVEGGRVTSKAVSAELLDVDRNNPDSETEDRFKQDFEAVRAFTGREVGILDRDVFTRDAYKGMCDYMNLIHDVSLSASGAQVSLAAPLTFNGKVGEGMMVFRDMSTIYPYENQLFVLVMTGKEIKDYLEYSYNQWIRTAGGPCEHVLNIENGEDPRNGQMRWSFVERTYNFDSAAGIVYAVDVTREFGSRIHISAMADGTAFNEAETYSVAMTSYRASGGGGLLEAAGISDSRDRIINKLPQMRDLIYDYLNEAGGWNTWAVSASDRLGAWTFAPNPLVSNMIENDFALLFGN